VNWIDLGTYKCKERIEQAIEFDEVNRREGEILGWYFFFKPPY